MERLGTDDPVKGQLLKKSAMHREQLEEEVKLISDKTQQVLTTALVIGGALAVTYLLVTKFTSGSRPRKKSKVPKIKLVQDDRQEDEEEVAHAPEGPSVMSQIGTALASQVTVFLLALAKEKLTEFLTAQSEKKNQANESAE